jgi:RimJ/RimL family protein N-acetyltransferase
VVKEEPLGLLTALEDGSLRLEPLAEHHREDLRAACAEDAGIWAIYGLSFGAAEFDISFDGLLDNPARLPFAVLVESELAGMTAWIDADPRRLSAEIGNTYLRPRFRGGAINGRMKRLLFAHGFARGLKRIQLSVDMRNERSRAACLKVGATFEGVLRNHYITWNGHERDSAIFSVVERDRERLGL